MIRLLSRPVFEALASLYDCGIEKVSGTDLQGDFSDCFQDLLATGMLCPCEPLRWIDCDDHDESIPVQKSPYGYMGYLCPDRGWVKVEDEVRKQYRFYPDMLVNYLHKELELAGAPSLLVSGLWFLGACRVGNQDIEVYWSSCQVPNHADAVRSALQSRSLLQRAVVLCQEINYRTCLGDEVMQLSLGALWNHDDLIDARRLCRAVFGSGYRQVLDEQGFLWSPESGTFVFPDRTTVTFKGQYSLMIVEHLVAQWRKGDPWISQPYLLKDMVGCKSDRVRDVVKTAIGWEKVILVKDNRCRLNLNLAPDPYDCKSVRPQSMTKAASGRFFCIRMSLNSTFLLPSPV